MAFAPVVAYSIGEDVASAVEIGAADRAANLRVAFQAVLGILVPEIKSAVSASGTESTMLRMEADRINGVDIAGVAVRRIGLTVAFEAKIVGIVLVIDVLDRAATFNAANGEPSVICEAGDDASLPLEWRLYGLVDGPWIAECDHVDHALCRADDKHLVVSRVHGVHTFLTIKSSRRLLLAQIPILHSLVPAASDQHWRVVDGHTLYAPDGLIMCSDLLCRSTTCAQVKHARGLVCTTAEDL